MNKIILIFLLLLSFTTKSQNTNKQITASLGEIQYVEDLKTYNSNFFVSGYTFNVAKPDGYSTMSFLKKYDKNLKLLWSLKINETNKSEINKVEIIDNRIYALITHGKNTLKTTETFLTLYIISLEGKILNKIKIGNSYSKPTNIIKCNNKICFGYAQASSIYYSNSNIIKSIYAEYDIKTKILKKKEGKTSICFPQMVLSQNSNVYVVGTYEKAVGDLISEHFILTVKNNEFQEKILHTNKSEYFLNAFATKNELDVLTTFPGVYGDLEKYLKFTYLNLLDNSITEKKIFFKDNKWEEVSFDTYSDSETTWLKVKDIHSKSFYAQINKEGNIKKVISLEKIGRSDKFLITNDYQIQSAENELKLTKEKEENL